MKKPEGLTISHIEEADAIREEKAPEKLYVSSEDYKKLQEELEKATEMLHEAKRKNSITEIVADELFKGSYEKVIVESEDGEIIYPFDKEQLDFLKLILSKKSPDNDEIKFIDPTKENLIFQYSEGERKAVLDGKEQVLKFKFLKNISHEKDFLTGLDKREFFIKKFEEYLKNSLGRAGGFAYLFFDMDKLKEVNDTFGHDAGDDILAFFGKLLKENTRSDDIAGRFGGDEFIVVLKNIPQEEALKKANKLRELFKGYKMSMVDKDTNTESFSTISVGGYYVDTSLLERGIDISELRKEIRQTADENLNTVKNSGKNAVLMTSNSDEKHIVREKKS